MQKKPKTQQQKDFMKTTVLPKKEEKYFYNMHFIFKYPWNLDKNIGHNKTISNTL